MEVSTLPELMRKHRLTDKDIRQQVSDSNLEIISCSCFKQWKSLPARLGLPTVAANIDKTQNDEKTKCVNHSRQPRQQLDMGQDEFNANTLVQSFVRMRRPDEIQHEIPLQCSQ